MATKDDRDKMSSIAGLFETKAIMCEADDGTRTNEYSEL